jgi:hypothetical protein
MGVTVLSWVGRRVFFRCWYRSKSRRCEFGVAGGNGTLGVACPTPGLGVFTLGGEERCCVLSLELVTWDGLLIGISVVGIAGDGAPLGASTGSSDSACCGSGAVISLKIVASLCRDSCCLCPMCAKGDAGAGFRRANVSSRAAYIASS